MTSLRLASLGALSIALLAACDAQKGFEFVTTAVTHRQTDGRVQVIAQVSCVEGSCPDPWQAQATFFTTKPGDGGVADCTIFGDGRMVLDTVQSAQQPLDKGISVEVALTSNQPIPAGVCVEVELPKDAKSYPVP